MVRMMEDDEFIHELDSDTARERRERSDRVSRRMGDLLLRGYRMLAGECEMCNCILMQLQMNQPICVNCEDNPMQQQQPQLQQQAQAIANDPQKREQPEKDPSEKIGELMLKGYTMLNETCDSCQTILMRDRRGKKICVICVDKPSQAVSAVPIESSIINTQQQQQQQAPTHSDVEKTILDKIEFGNSRLKLETDVTRISELCQMIKIAAEALTALRVCLKR